ncbi:MAG: hypothetical protein WA691_05115 [Thermoplasmata archaeon]
MNRSIVFIGVGIFVVGLALISFPIAVTGQEQFDLEQESGLFFIAPAMAFLLVGAISDDPRVTTIGGTLGNPEFDRKPDAVDRPAAHVRSALGYNPREPVRCRHCSTIISFDLAQCPRCARPRECRGCGRPVGIVLDRVTCPSCAREEPFCNCPHLPPRPVTASARSRRV